jgi:peptide/nickel transport system ATP-binding protein
MGQAAPNNKGSASPREPVLRTEHLRAYYQMKYFGIAREVRAVDDISLHVDRNEIYGLAGESSCGKTTFIKTVARAIRPPLNVVGGSVRYSFLDRDLYEIEPERMAEIRWAHISYIMQGSMNVLNPLRRVRQSFLDFAFRHIARPKKEFFEIVSEHLERLHLSPAILKAYPHELSGGMRQRVTIALATVCQPEFIIADEPTTALDVIVQKSVLGMIREVQQRIGSSILLVTHDLAVHANVADRLGIMYAGRLVEEGRTADIFRNPLHPYTAHLIASLPRIGDLAPKAALIGSPPNLAAPPPGCRFNPRCPLAMDICRREVPALTVLAPGHRVACFAADPSVRPQPEAPVDARERALPQATGAIQ